MARRVGHQRAEIIAAANALRVLPFLLDPDAANPTVERILELARQIGARRFGWKRWLPMPRSSRLRAGSPKLWT